MPNQLYMMNWLYPHNVIKFLFLKMLHIAVDIVADPTHKISLSQIKTIFIPRSIKNNRIIMYSCYISMLC